MPEVKMSALKALKASTRVLTKSQRQNLFCILRQLIESDVSDSIRNETLSCFKEAATHFKEEMSVDILVTIKINLKGKK